MGVQFGDKKDLEASKGAKLSIDKLMRLNESAFPVLSSTSTLSTSSVSKSKVSNAGELLGLFIGQSGLVENGRSAFSRIISYIISMDHTVIIVPVLIVVEYCLLFLLAFLRGYNSVNPQIKTKISQNESDKNNITTLSDENRSTRWVQFCVGGVLFQTTLSTISRYPNSILYKQLCQLRHTETQIISFDRDPRPFRHILNSLRGQDILSYIGHDPIALTQLINECHFYGLNSLAETITSQIHQ